MLVLVLAAFTWLFYQNAWTGDDPYVTFRSVDNWVRGWGITWNTGERVQAYTHPLWMLVLSACYFFTREAFFTPLAISYVIDIALLVLLFRALKKEPLRFAALSLLLVSSKAFVDYSSSGLENPLSHLLAVLYFAPYLFGDPPRTLTRFRNDVLLASLAFITRTDTIVFYAPMLGYSLFLALKEYRARAVVAVLQGAVPAILWYGFATIYYGFPLPNTAYSKLNGGRLDVPFFHKNAFAYFQNSFEWDPPTLILIALGCAAGIYAVVRRPRIGPVPLTVAGVVLYLGYVVRIGGDYMSGRFFALPLLLAMMVLVAVVPDRRLTMEAAVVAFVLAFAGPRPPVLASGLNDHGGVGIERTGIRDERGGYHGYSDLSTVVARRDWTFGRADARKLNLHGPTKTVVIWGAIGHFGYENGPETHDVDFIGLSDALVARIPVPDVMERWGRGHLFRTLPEGYIESIEAGENLIVDPSLHEVYDKLLIITTGPIWRASRFRAVWEMNTGKYRKQITEYGDRNVH